MLLSQNYTPALRWLPSGHEKAMRKRLHLALGAYLVLAVLAGLTLDGKIRLATWVFLGGLALKSLINYFQSS